MTVSAVQVVEVRVELVHPKLCEFHRRLIDAGIYPRKGSGFSMWAKANQGVPLEREMWVTGGNYDVDDLAELRRIHDEVAAGT